MDADALGAGLRNAVAAASAAGRCECLPAGPLAVQLATPVRRKRLEPVFTKGGEIDQEVDRTGHPAGDLFFCLEHGFVRYGRFRTDARILQSILQAAAKTA